MERKKMAEWPRPDMDTATQLSGKVNGAVAALFVSAHKNMSNDRQGDGQG
ncbi:hypothetical protein [Desulfonatronum thioautotrophicum]|nr:hypothetical protein [Desulfonatronum thioautotrophicum]